MANLQRFRRFATQYWSCCAATPNVGEDNAIVSAAAPRRVARLEKRGRPDPQVQHQPQATSGSYWKKLAGSAVAELPGGDREFHETLPLGSPGTPA